MYRFLLKTFFPASHRQIEADEKKCNYSPPAKEELRALREAPRKPLGDETPFDDRFYSFVLSLSKAAGIAERRMPVLSKAEGLLDARVKQKDVSPLAALLVGKTYAKERALLERVISVRDESNQSLRKQGKTLGGVAARFESSTIFNRNGSKRDNGAE